MKPTSALVALLVSITAMPGAAMAQSGEAWRSEVVANGWTKTGDSSNAVILIKKGRVTGTVHELWVRFERKDPQAGDARPYMSNTSLYEANCANRQVRLTRAVRYAERNLGGASEEVAGGPTEWETPGSGGVLAFALQQACGAG